MSRKPLGPLTAEFVRSILDYDTETGEFRWKHRPEYPAKWNGKWAGRVAGCRSREGYVLIGIGEGKLYRAHVLAWLYVYGEWKSKEIDHINRVRHDNRITNLRIATFAQNSCNRAKQSNNRSGAIGIRFDDKSQRWLAAISHKRGKIRWTRRFATFEEAAEARRRALTKIHGEFAAE